MDLTPFVDQLRRDLLTAADAGGDEARALAERLTAPLESSVRLALLSALSTGGRGDHRPARPRRRRRAAPRQRPRLRRHRLRRAARRPGRRGVRVAEPSPAADVDEGGTSRITLRLPEQLKARVDDAAARLGVSVNTWLVRAVANAMGPDAPGRRPTAGAAGGPAARSTPAGRADPAPHAAPRPRPTGPGTPTLPEEGAAMPTFDTPGPSTARIEVAGGSVHVRADRPARHRRHGPPAQPARAPPTSRPPSRRGSSSPTGSCWSARPAGRDCSSSAAGPEIDVDVVLPDGLVRRRPHDGRATSTAPAGWATSGSRRSTATSASSGPAALRARTSSGDISATAVEGEAEATTSYGDVRVGETAGDLPAGHRLRRHHRRPGPRLADRHARSTARCASARPSAARWSSRPPTARSRPACARGRPPGSTSHSGSGRIRNLLTETEGPEGADETVEIHARTSYGDILIRRA